MNAPLISLKQKTTRTLDNNSAASLELADNKTSSLSSELETVFDKISTLESQDLQRVSKLYLPQVNELKCKNDKI